MTEGATRPLPEIRPLARIGPSRFDGLTQCALREVLAAQRTEVALPSAPPARLGTAIHKLLENAASGALDPAGSAVEDCWTKLVAEEEAEMAASWLERHFAPLRESMGAYDERRLQAIARARELATIAYSGPRKPRAGNAPQSDSGYGTEMWVETAAGDVGGAIDAVVRSDDGPVIRDYKTGRITDETGEPRTAYATQLRLYAAMYAEKFGVWPHALELVNLRGDIVRVSLDQNQCDALLADARKLREDVNASIAQSGDPLACQEALATPAPDNCRYCNYRPLCHPYREVASLADPDAGWPGDLAGTLVEQRVLGNGRVFLRLAVDATEGRVRGLTNDVGRHPALALLAGGQMVEVYNTRVIARFSVEERLPTVLYAEAPGE